MDSSYFANGKVYAWEGTFAVVKAKQPIAGAFAVLQDKNEITVVIEQSRIGEHQNDILESSNDWNIITFDMLLSLNMVGFIAHVTSALAKKGVDVLTFSAYSTEHVLVQSKDLAKALTVLEHLGCKISSNS
ncbi:MAG: hypothetical protein Greene071421_116 [Parcubacteria group bacterium Greene0714_21]|nr:MAG: hypothetical protein Greene041639_235 [Parcubacteria group bacterium Greene0416_39]TSC98519.1 MAG: hypothetical protein Greene101447_21 [Parcubacteria group bacterium Greene1014_47]TSD04280.1 MAG: hypothetical protein Greene071421_116 [Parcubacteria group bacterium Greene0714_21]